MKGFGRWFGAAVLVLGVTGCDSGAPTTTGPSEVTPDNRPAGFEDMMKGMGDQMKKPGAPGKAAPASAAGPAGAPK